MLKRDRTDAVERDSADVQQRRLGQRQQRNAAWRGGGGRKEGDFTNEPMLQDPGFLSMEFDIQREMVGAVIGKGGGTARSIRSRTGASVHVHSPQNENARTFVELRGRREQIETAFEELRSVVASVDEEYAKHMHASVTLKTKPESVGCLIGKQGQNIKQIEEETRARVRVEPHEEGEEFQCVHVCGDVMAVELATQMVQESLDRYDASRAKKQQQQQFPPHLPRLPVQPTKPAETKTTAPQEVIASKTEAETMPPIYIQAPTGGFGSQPAILVLQADGTYHAAQIVTASEGGLNPAGLVTIVGPQGVQNAASGYVSTVQSQSADSKSQMLHQHQGVYAQQQTQTFVPPPPQPSQPLETKSHLMPQPTTFPTQNSATMLASQSTEQNPQMLPQPSIFAQQNTGYASQSSHSLDAKSPSLQPTVGYSSQQQNPGYGNSQASQTMDPKFQMTQSAMYTQQTPAYVPQPPPPMEVVKSQQFIQQPTVYPQQTPLQQPPPPPTALQQQIAPITVSQSSSASTVAAHTFQSYGSQLFALPEVSVAPSTPTTGWMTGIDQGQQAQMPIPPIMAPVVTDAVQADIRATLNTVSFLQSSNNYPPPPS